MPKIAVLGAGSGGAMTANILRRKLGRDQAEITVIDKSTKHIYQPSFYLLPFDYLQPEDQTRDVTELFDGSIDFVNDEITGVDPDEKVVECVDHEIAYDYLVVSTGHRLAPETTPGMVEGWEETDSVHPYYHYEGAMSMREALEDFDGGRFVVTVPDTPIKCGGAPLKMSMLAEDYMRRQGIREESEIIMAKPGDAVFGVEPYKSKLEEIWSDRDITFEGNFTVAEIDYENEVIHSEEGKELEYDFYAPVSPQYGQEAITEHSPLTEGDDEHDGEYVTVDKHTLQHDEYDDVFALGDADNTPKSRTAAAARKQAHVVANNIEALIDDRPMRDEYHGYAACPLLTKKGKAMVAEFDYEESISAPIESKMNWIMDINVLPSVYWNLWMRGYDPLP